MGFSTSKARTPSERDPISSKIGSKMGGELTYPKMVPLVLTHSHVGNIQSNLTDRGVCDEDSFREASRRSGMTVILRM